MQSLNISHNLSWIYCWKGKIKQYNTQIQYNFPLTINCKITCDIVKFHLRPKMGLPLPEGMQTKQSYYNVLITWNKMMKIFYKNDGWLCVTWSLPHLLVISGAESCSIWWCPQEEKLVCASYRTVSHRNTCLTNISCLYLLQLDE